ncbi:hypothetical protein ILYODFUR_016564 [Ilyodon furcidens]|uniref:Uncharacterized protein n=1 Tax=Ilyodon furcidens TaxID=33524 RepID=A0ABV0TM37_9TELE
MHRPTKQRAFAPLLHRPLTYLPMEHQDRKFSLQPPRYFDPVSGFHRATQTSSRSAIQRRSSAIHVTIAWRIYYHKQLKKRQQKSNTPPQEMFLKFPITSLPDSQQPKEPQPACRHQYLDSAFRSTGGSSETRRKEANSSHDRSNLSGPHPSNPAFHLDCETQDNLNREKLKHSLKLLLDEKADMERHKSCQTNTTLSPPFLDKSSDPKMIHEPDGQQCSSLDRKRHLGGCSFDDMKRLKQEAEDKMFDPLLFTSNSSLCVSCHNGCRCIISYPGTELHPYHTASSEQTWNHRMNVSLRQKVFEGYFCDRFHRFLGPHLYSPLALRCQDTVYLRDQETLPSFLSLL